MPTTDSVASTSDQERLYFSAVSVDSDLSRRGSSMKVLVHLGRHFLSIALWPRTNGINKIRTIIPGMADRIGSAHDVN